MPSVTLKSGAEGLSGSAHDGARYPRSDINNNVRARTCFRGKVARKSAVGAEIARSVGANYPQRYPSTCVCPVETIWIAVCSAPLLGTTSSTKGYTTTLGWDQRRLHRVFPARRSAGRPPARGLVRFTGLALQASPGEKEKA